MKKWVEPNGLPVEFAGRQRRGWRRWLRIACRVIAGARLREWIPPLPGEGSGATADAKGDG